MNKQIEEDKGSDIASRVLIPAQILGIGTDVESVLSGYVGLKTEEARRSFLDDVRLSMEKSLPNGWTRVYIAMHIMRQEEWYWKGLGYKTFDAYLEEECGFPFKEFERLEKLYCFAAKCCPKLFKVSKKDLTEVMEAWRNAPGLMTKHGGDRRSKTVQGAAKNLRHLEKPTNGSVAKQVDLNAQSEEFQAGYKARGSNNRLYRFQRLKRDAPKVAGDVLGGKYLKQQKNGEWIVDLDAAEDAAIKRYGAKFKPPSKASRRTPIDQRVIKLLVNATDDEWNAVVDWMNKYRVAER